MSFTLRSTARHTQDLLVDLAVHFVKARGATSRKVFKPKRVSLEPRASVDLAARVSLKLHTTRKPQPGRHSVELLVNGVGLPIGSFDVISRG